MIELTIIDNTGKRWCRTLPNRSTYDIRGDEVSIDFIVTRERKPKEETNERRTDNETSGA